MKVSVTWIVVIAKVTGFRRLEAWLEGSDLLLLKRDRRRCSDVLR